MVKFDSIWFIFYIWSKKLIPHEEFSDSNFVLRQSPLQLTFVRESAQRHIDTDIRSLPSHMALFRSLILVAFAPLKYFSASFFQCHYNEMFIDTLFRGPATSFAVTYFARLHTSTSVVHKHMVLACASVCVRSTMRSRVDDSSSQFINCALTLVEWIVPSGRTYRTVNANQKKSSKIYLQFIFELIGFF